MNVGFNPNNKMAFGCRYCKLTENILVEGQKLPKSMFDNFMAVTVTRNELNPKLHGSQAVDIFNRARTIPEEMADNIRKNPTYNGRYDTWIKR